jgi:hypothetical protein
MAPTADPIPTLTLLARLYEDQALAAWTDGHDDDGRFYDGAASAVRVALHILVPMPGGPRKPKTAARASPVAVPVEIPVERGGTKKPPMPQFQVKTRKGVQYACPECGATYKLPQHLGAHRKREHGVPSQRDLEQRQG